ncbi:hypothetical protein RRG08_006566 [Elysia crispata]|uniref:Uncharacterized protein n=1 Tax=Elysia crispata TaxID=231223 RepID=A0AAE0Z9E8_9GAST|nr:hypothetical protein RRG08_006566 [Elysia crispata]
MSLTFGEVYPSRGSSWAVSDPPKDCSTRIKGMRTTDSSSYTTFGVHMCTSTKTKGAVKSGSYRAVADTPRDLSTRIKGVRTTDSSSYTTFGVHMCTSTKGAVKS